MSSVKFDDLPTHIQKQMALSSPFILGKFILGYDKFGIIQKEWSDWIRKNVDANNLTNKKVLRMYPRETYKSTFWTVVFSVFIIINNPNLTILIASSTFGNSTDFLREIKGCLLSTRFVEIFGDLTDRNDWTASTITVKRDVNKKESTISCTGLGVTLTSKHYDIVLLDDIASTLDRDSGPARKKTLEFFGDIWDLLKKDKTFFMMVGTRWHIKDIYHHIIRIINKKLIDVGLEPIDIEIKPAYGTGKTIDFNDYDASKENFPTILNKKKLLELRALKDISMFQAQYQLNPLSGSDQIFKKFHYYTHQATKYKCFVIYTDPALSIKSGACYSAIVCIGKIDGGINDNKWGVCFADIDKRSPGDLVRAHNNMYIMVEDAYHKIIDILMEQNGFQVLLKDEMHKHALELKRSIPTVGRTAKLNKTARISAMEPQVTEGFLLFRDDWREASGNYKLLIEQMESFPQGEVDGPDALEGAVHQSKYVII